MADNTTLNSGSGGDSIATDDISGVKYPRSKIVIGADGTNDGDVSSSNPLPVSDNAAQSSLQAIADDVNGTLTATLVAGETGGTSTFYDADLDETAQQVSSSALSIYSVVAFNTGSQPRYLQMFDATSATIGTDTPTNQYVIPGSSGSDGSGFVIPLTCPKAYGTGLVVACTTDSEGSGAPSAGDCIVNIEYKAS